MRPTPTALTLAAAGLLAACGTDVTGPSSSLLQCVSGGATELAVGEALQVRGEKGRGVCLTPGAGAGVGLPTFIYVPFFAAQAEADSVDALGVEITGAGLAPSGSVVDRTAAASIRLGRATAPTYVRDYTFHDAIRRQEADELARMVRPGVPPQADPVAAAVAADVPSVGDLRDFNVAISCSAEDIRTGEVVYVSDHAVVYADTANPADLPASDYAVFGETFDTLVYPIETAHFGTPTDIDGNGRSILFHTRAVNERNQPGSQSVTVGFFWSGDLFPEVETERLQACPAANHSEMFYVLAPDPTGEVGVPFTLDQVRDLAIPVIGHEFQHLINASRRLLVNNARFPEEGWLNEGLSHAAEELLFFGISGLQPGQNLTIQNLRDAGAIDAFNRYMGGNFNNYALYLSRPDTSSLRGSANDLTTRGAAWAFLRYAADRAGRGDEAFFNDVVNARSVGLANLDAAVGGSSLEWIRDWTVSIAADDFVSGIDARFTTTSWNWLSVYRNSSIGDYPLQLQGLQSGQTYSASLLSGGATFNRFSVAHGDRAIVHAEPDGRVSDLWGSYIRIR